MRRSAVRGVALAGLIGCGGSGPDPVADAPADAPPSANGEWQSGTRLRAIVDGEGTARVLAGWRDTELGVDCEWVEGPGGLRCLPAYVENATVVFSDAGCTQPRVMMSDCLTPPAYVRRGLRPCYQPDTYQVGAEVAVSGQIYYGLPGACSASSPVPTSGYKFHTLTAVPASMFVAATTRREPRGDRLAQDVILGADGSVDGREFYDATLGIHCARSRSGIGLGTPAACEPASFGNALGYFTDGTCQERVAGWGYFRSAPFCSDGPKYALVPPFNGPQGYTFATFGDEVTGEIYENAGTCRVGQRFQEFRYFRIGPLVDPAGWAPVSSRIEGTGRLRVSALASPTGERLAGRGLFDDQLGVECAPGIAGDGMRRCLPIGASDAFAFADAACKVPAIFVSAGATPPRYVLSGTAVGCEYRLSYHAVAATPGVAKAYTPAGMMCVEMTGAPVERYHATTGEVPPETFLRLAPVVE